MRRRDQSSGPSRRKEWYCPVADCGDGPFRKDKLYGAGGHLQKMAQRGREDHELLWEEQEREKQRRLKRQRGAADITQHFGQQQEAVPPPPDV